MPYAFKSGRMFNQVQDKKAYCALKKLIEKIEKFSWTHDTTPSLRQRRDTKIGTWLGCLTLSQSLIRDDFGQKIRRTFIFTFWIERSLILGAPVTEEECSAISHTAECGIDLNMRCNNYGGLACIPRHFSTLCKSRSSLYYRAAIQGIRQRTNPQETGMLFPSNWDASHYLHNSGQSSYIFCALI